MTPSNPPPLTVKVPSLLAMLGLSLAACSPTGSFHAGEGLLVEPVLEEPVILEEAAPDTSSRKSTSAARRTVKSGVLTAGDIDDTLNLREFVRYQKAAHQQIKLPKSNLTTPVMARLLNPNGKAAQRVRYTLRKPNAAQPFYEGYSGVDGNITVFPAVLNAGRLSKVELRAFPAGQGQATTQTLQSIGVRHTVTLPTPSRSAPGFLDLTFVIDTTGSMADELQWLTKEMQTIVRAARKSVPGVDIRYGLIVYRDKGDDYVVKNYGFTNQAGQMKRWLRQQTASGGGDYPEAAAAALRQGVAMDWRRGNGERLMFHIADAPPHRSDARAYLDAARQAAAANIQIFGLGASGVAAESEFLMRQAAVQTSGRYLFLTDDSGIGHTHAEPTISCYHATQLTGLMVRVLKSELSGRRVEASEKQIVRRVGSYDRGVCKN